MSDASFQRLRRLLLLLPVVARASRAGRGVPLARAVELTGARDEATLRADVAAVADLWTEPAGGGDAIDLYLEDGELWITYELQFGTPPAFSLVEGALLLAALRPFEEGGDRAVSAVARKLRRAIPEVLRPEAERLAAGLDVTERPPEPWAGALEAAIAQRLETTIAYRSVADAEVARRVVEPRILFPHDGVWYLAAWNVAKESEHLYRLDRIVGVEPGTRIFPEHRGPPVSRYVRRNLFFESGAEREVRLRFRGTSARLARDRFGDRAREEPGGAVLATVRLTPGDFLLGYVLGHGGEAEVDGPPDVAAALRARAARLLDLYR